MRNLIFISFLFLLFSCKGDSQKKEAKQETKQEPEWFSIELAKTLTDATTDQKPYSTFVKDIEYIPLQTTSKSLIGGGRRGIKIHTVTKKVIVADMKIFNRKDGRYIGDLLSRGQGPKEYLYPDFLVADDDREEFYLVESDKKRMHIVGYDNSYKKEAAWDNDFTKNMIALGNGNLLIIRGQMLKYGYDDFQIINIDTNKVLSKRSSSAFTNLENIVDHKHIVKYNTNGMIVTTAKNIFWRYKDNIRYYDYLTDSLFTIDKDMHVKSIGTLDFEKLKNTKDQAQVPFFKQSFFTWSIHKIVETSDEILFSFNSRMMKPRGGSNYFLTYSKVDKTTKITTQGDRVLPEGILPPSPYINDFDNGVAFSPTHATQNESAYYDLISAESIKELVEEKGAAAYTTEKEKAFKAMADTLKYDDNEVVGILHVDW